MSNSAKGVIAAISLAVVGGFILLWAFPSWVWLGATLGAFLGYILFNEEEFKGSVKDLIPRRPSFQRIRTYPYRRFLTRFIWSFWGLTSIGAFVFIFVRVALVAGDRYDRSPTVHQLTPVVALAFQWLFPLCLMALIAFDQARSFELFGRPVEDWEIKERARMINVFVLTSFTVKCLWKQFLAIHQDDMLAIIVWWAIGVAVGAYFGYGFIGLGLGTLLGVTVHYYVSAFTQSAKSTA